MHPAGKYLQRDMNKAARLGIPYVCLQCVGLSVFCSLYGERAINWRVSRG